MVDVKNIKLHRKGAKAFLTPLEADILNILWKSGKRKVREVHGNLRRKDVALTSVAVLLDRLHKKGVVDRHVEKGRGGMHYIYFPRFDREGFHQSIIEKTVDKLIDTFGQTAVSYFNTRFNRGGKK